MGLALKVKGLGAVRMRYLLDGFSVGGGGGGGGAEGGEWTISSSVLRVGKGRDWKRGKSAFGLSFASRGIR